MRRAAPFTKHLLPYEDVASRRHHRFPLSDQYQRHVRQARDGRARRPHPAGQQEGLSQRHAAERAVRRAQDRIHRFLPRQFPRRAQRATVSAGAGDAAEQRRWTASWWCRPDIFRHGRQPRFIARQPLLGIRAAREHHRHAADDLLVVRRAHRRLPAPISGSTIFFDVAQCTSSPRRAGTGRSTDSVRVDVESISSAPPETR